MKKKKCAVVLLVVNLALGGLNAQFSEGAEENDQFGLAFAIINDNYTGSVERGQQGYYIGPDDFITAAFLLRFYWRNWRIAITENVLTSRHFNYRYDLLFAALAREYRWGELILLPEVGLVTKGRYRGADIQNWFHQLRAIPDVSIPYSSGGIGGFLALTVEGELFQQVGSTSYFYAALELRLVTDYAPSRIVPVMGCQTEIWRNRIQFESLLGWRYLLNEIDQYSELVESGILGAVSVKVRLYKKIYFDFGLSVYPARNLENDPLYANKAHNYIPQIWSVFSWNTAGRGLRNYIDY
ncbi:MAG: hypothetical protein HQ528_01785 [Candidatus Marinimicrobia bacterium]|nr:hypothetical protein [Candidatus Neomarinimicrobiota bacterium]